MNNFGANLKLYRSALGLSQAELADKVDVHQTMIAQIENGHKTPGMSLALRLAQFFNVTIEDMLASKTRQPEPA